MSDPVAGAEAGSSEGRALWRDRRRSVLAVLLLLAVSAAALAWWTAPVPVRVAAVARGEAAEIVYASGVVEPRSSARVASLVRDRIVWTCDCEGRQVAAGTELARLDDREARAQLEEVRARRDLAARDLARLGELAARSIATRHELERAETAMASAQALVSAQEARLDTYVLRAPISGMVLRQDAEVGEIAEPGAALFIVGQPRPLRVVAEVNEEDIPRVRPGQTTLIRADAFPGRVLEATVDRITPAGDPLRRSWRVRFALPGDTPLMIGMSVEVNIVTERRAGVLLVPAGAFDADGAVWVVRDGRARRRTVETGIRGDAKVEVMAGLEEGEPAIVPPPAGLAEGARVRVEAAE